MSFISVDDRNQHCPHCGGMYSLREVKLGVDTDGELLRVCPLCGEGEKV